MRQVGRIAKQADAQRFADYLLTEGITSKIDEVAEGWAVWIREEEHVGRAVEELQQFQLDPQQARYREAHHQAQKLRREEAHKEKEYRRRIVDVSTQLGGPAPGRLPVTIALIIVSVLVTLLTWFGTNRTMVNYFSIATMTYHSDMIVWPRLMEIWRGEVWRLVTPIFLHFGTPPFHLLFNMFWLWYMGGQLEHRRGSWRLLIMVLVIAGSSNLAEYYWPPAHPNFGGMSGVNYGLLGYVWMKSRFEPGLGLFISPANVALLVAWLLLCMTGLLGPVANVAHSVGLLGGVAIGYGPIFWRQFQVPTKNQDGP